MNGANFCSGLSIVPMSFAYPFSEVYKMQRTFQLKVGSLDTSANLAVDAAHKCIYWFYCIVDERQELLDWFDPEFNTKNLSLDQIKQEIQMEAIDMFHFVMNLGLELKFTPEEIQDMADACQFVVHVPQAHICEDVSRDLSDRIIKMIGGLPWKKWKTYEAFTIDDVKDLVRTDYVQIYQRMLHLCGKVELTKEDIINVYCAKNRENISRQDNGY